MLFKNAFVVLVIFKMCSVRATLRAYKMVRAVCTWQCKRRSEIFDPAFSSGPVTEHLICPETLSMPVPSLSMQMESKTWSTCCLYIAGLVQPVL